MNASFCEKKVLFLFFYFQIVSYSLNNRRSLIIHLRSKHGWALLKSLDMTNFSDIVLGSQKMQEICILDLSSLSDQYLLPLSIEIILTYEECRRTGKTNSFICPAMGYSLIVRTYECRSNKIIWSLWHHRNSIVENDSRKAFAMDRSSITWWNHSWPFLQGHRKAHMMNYVSFV